MWRFYRQALAHALQDWWATIWGHKGKSLGLWFATTVVTLALQWALFGLKEMLHVLQISLTVVGSGMIVGFPVLIWKSLGAPFLLYKEREKQADQEKDDLLARIRDLRAGFEVERQKLELENAHLHSLLDTSSKRKAIRQKLGEFLSEGQTLLAMSRQEDFPSPESEATRWGMRVEDFLTQALDSSWAMRFRNPVGVPPLAIPSRTDKQRKTVEGIHIRLCHLQDFIKELAS